MRWTVKDVFFAIPILMVFGCLLGVTGLLLWTLWTEAGWLAPATVFFALWLAVGANYWSKR